MSSERYQEEFKIEALRMTDNLTPSRQAPREALTLSEEILRNLELNEVALANVALKTSRLARLLNDFPHHKIIEYE